ncbi:SHOCT domain-containing protein [Paenibacillus caui]|uniref:SHOCT domain-containing protein n=1 Tax=Paenibacillus caui TaxID=2873927 RepID=UPI001CA80F71|nr:SHOCT domain-containing protein [Paenibacillus caui]
MMDGMMMNSSMMLMMCMIMGVGALIFVIILGSTVYVVVRSLMMKSRVVDRPLMLLKERYVKGELSDEEYSRMRKTISE